MNVSFMASRKKGKWGGGGEGFDCPSFHLIRLCLNKNKQKMVLLS
jgi:hypothetical protein